MNKQVKTSGEGNAKIAIGVVGLPSVAVRAIGVKVAEINKLAVRRAAFSCAFPSKASAIRILKNF